MNRLRAELRRLYGLEGGGAPDGRSSTQGRPDAADATRVLVLEVAAPADWRSVGEAWRGVQHDLGLPAPAIAVNGVDGMQLWFALPEGAGVQRAKAFGEALRRRYLAGVPLHRVRCWPADPADAAAPVPALPPVPAEQPSGNWSAFVAPDLAPLFAETPWLDIPPGEEAQASLLAGLAPVPPRAFEAALAALGPPGGNVAAAAPAAAKGAEPPTPPAAWRDPREFLLAVMNDPQAPLALRVDAAKALLATPPGNAGDAPSKPSACPPGAHPP